MDSKVDFVETLTSGLEAMLKTGNHADVTVVVEGKVFPCHKVILCALSPYFEAMFTHDMVETRGGIVTLYDVDPETFEILLQFMYSGEDHVDATNAEKVFRASSVFQIACLQRRCEKFLIDQVSRENCVGIWNIARAHNCENLAKKSLEIVLENFEEVASSTDFLKLGVEEVLCAVKSQTLKAPNEEFICDAVMTWMKYDVINRQKHLGKLFEHLKMPLVSSDYLFHLMEDEYFDLSLESSQLLKEAVKYVACPTKRNEFTSERFEHRLSSSKNDVLVLIGGLLKVVPRFQTTKEVICYSLQQEKWFYLPSLPYDPGYEFAVCTHGSDIYVSGGWMKLNGMAVYKADKNKWKTCDTMINGRCGHAMVGLSTALYAIGGRDGKAPAITGIEEFSLKTKKWRHVGNLLQGIRSMSATAIGENIFVFGGITETDKDTDTIQCYDTRHGTATIIGDLPFTCRLTRTVTCDNVVYIILPDGRVIIFDSQSSRRRLASLSDVSVCSENDDKSNFSFSLDTSLPSPVSPSGGSSPAPTGSDNVLGKVKGRLPGFNQHHFEAIQHRGNFLLVGGKTPENTILKQIMVINSVTSKIYPCIEMPTARWCFGSVKSVIETCYLNNKIGADVAETDESVSV